jgi:hypothetical protein
MVISFYDYMLAKYGESPDLTEFMSRAYTVLEIEHRFWMNQSNGHAIAYIYEGDLVFLNKYKSDLNTARPESYYQDVQTAAFYAGDFKKQ